MKRLALLLLLTPFSAFAYQEARLSPETLRLRVGESADVQVGIHHMSGFNYTMWRFFFGTDRTNIIALDGTLDYHHPVWSGTIHVVGLAPGTAYIVNGGREYVYVEVVCGFVEPIKAVTPVILAKKGEPVKLSVAAPFETGRVLRWYSGRVGDTSKPLTSPNGFDMTVTPEATGTYYVWASSTSPCATSSAEFRIDVPVVRRRAVGRLSPKPHTTTNSNSPVPGSIIIASPVSYQGGSTVTVMDGPAGITTLLWKWPNTTFVKPSCARLRP